MDAPTDAMRQRLREKTGAEFSPMEFTNWSTGMQAAYGPEFGVETKRRWYQALKRYPAEAVRAALNLSLQWSKTGGVPDLETVREKVREQMDARGLGAGGGGEQPEPGAGRPGAQPGVQGSRGPAPALPRAPALNAGGPTRAQRRRDLLALADRLEATQFPHADLVEQIRTAARRGRDLGAEFRPDPREVAESGGYEVTLAELLYLLGRDTTGAPLGQTGKAALATEKTHDSR